MSTRLAAAALALAGLGFFAPAGGQDMSGPCQEMTGQYDANGRLQLISGLACLQPDGTWQMVDIYGAGGATYDDPYYYGGDPWYWAPFGYGVVIFIDRFHHVHHVSHAFMHRPGAGFHGGMGGFHGGMGGFHGNGGGFHGNSGGFQGGGGHR